MRGQRTNEPIRLEGRMLVTPRDRIDFFILFHRLADRVRQPGKSLVNLTRSEFSIATLDEVLGTMGLITDERKHRIIESLMKMGYLESHYDSYMLTSAALCEYNRILHTIG